MKKRVPTAVLVIAILNFVFGGVAFLGSSCGGAFSLLSLFIPEQTPGQPGYIPNMVKVVAKELPSYTAYLTASLGIGLVMSTLLIVAGIGLLRLRPWARWLCIFYAPVQILLQVGNLYYTLVYVNPVMQRATQELFRQLPPGAPNFANFGAGSLLSNIGAFAGAFFFTAYPVALLVVLFLPQVRAAFAGQRGLAQEVPRPAEDVPEVG